MSPIEKYELKRVINAIGTPTIIGANVAAPEVIAAVGEMLAMNVEIDELQGAASRLIARITGAEAGCITSSAASGIAIAAAAAMTGADLEKIARLPDTSGLRNEVILQYGHDVNFGARISQMIRLSGARVIPIGAANHADSYQLRGAVNGRTAAILFVVNPAVHPEGTFIPLDRCVEIAAGAGVPVIVDAAAEADIRPLLRAGASLVITSGHKAMGAPTSGLMCGRKHLVRACYLQNWGIGRAMKAGKEAIAGAMAALERWYGRDIASETRDYERLSRIVARKVKVRATDKPYRFALEMGPRLNGRSPRQVANLLREGDPPIWVNEATATDLIVDLRVLDTDGAELLGDKIAQILESASVPAEDTPYHDLYWSEERLLRWPD